MNHLFSFSDISLLGTLAIAVYFLLIFEARAFESSLKKKQDQRQKEIEAQV